MLGPALLGQEQNQLKIRQVFLSINGGVKDADMGKYRMLIPLQPGDYYNSRKARQGLKDLYKTGLFANVEIKIERLTGDDIHLYFVLYKNREFSGCGQRALKRCHIFRQTQHLFYQG